MVFASSISLRAYDQHINETEGLKCFSVSKNCIFLCIRLLHSICYENTFDEQDQDAAVYIVYCIEESEMSADFIDK